MNTHTQRISLLMASIVLLIDLAYAQVISDDLGTADSDSNVLIHGVDPGKLLGTPLPDLQLAGIGRPAVLSDENFYLQGRGQMRRVRLTFPVSVENRGEGAGGFQIVVEVEGATELQRTSLITLPGRDHHRQIFNFTTDVQLPSGGTAIPMNVVLLNQSGSELTRRATSANVNAVPVEPTPPPPGTDLMITDMTVGMKLMPAVIGQDGGTEYLSTGSFHRDGMTQATVTVRNAGTERWGYRASVSVTYHAGQPGRLTALDGAAGATKPIPGGLESGQSDSVNLHIKKALSPGYYYTATARIRSSDDAVAANNQRVFVFFVEEDGRVIPVEDERRNGYE